MATKKKKEYVRRTPEELALIIAAVAQVLPPGGATNEELQLHLGIEAEEGRVGPLELPLKLGTTHGVFRRTGKARGTRYTLAMPTARDVQIVMFKVFGGGAHA